MNNEESSDTSVQLESDFAPASEADLGQKIMAASEAELKLRQENADALCGHTEEEVSHMFNEVMANNPEAMASLNIGEQTKQIFSDTQVVDAEAYDVIATNQQLNEKVIAVSNMVVTLLGEVYAHLAQEYNRAVILEQEELRKELILAEAPRWYDKSADRFQESFMLLRRSLNQRSGF